MKKQKKSKKQSKKKKKRKIQKNGQYVSKINESPMKNEALHEKPKGQKLYAQWRKS